MAAVSEESKSTVLVVWDFDWSMINENTDTWVFDKLNPPLRKVLSQFKSHEQSWTDVVDAALQELTKSGVTVDQIVAAQQEIPVFPENIAVVQWLACQPGVTNVILSNANTVYIDAVLKKHALSGCITEVITNPAEVIDGMIRVKSLHGPPSPHTCALCPQNLCKGIVYDELLAKYRPEQVLYIGDGGGDFCPIKAMRPLDVAFVRASYPLHKMVLAQPDSVKARIHEWSTGAELAEGIKACFAAAS